MALVGCGTKTSADSSLPSSATDPSSSSTFVFPTFTDDDFDGLIGTYYGTEGNLSLQSDVVNFGDLALYPSEIQQGVEFKVGDEAIARNVYYLSSTKESLLNDYRIYLSTDSKIKLVLEKKEGDGFSKVATFAPSTEKFSGSYSGFENSLSSYDVILNIGDAFNADVGYFISSYVFGGSFYSNYFYVDSYFVEQEGEFVEVLDLIDSSDGIAWYEGLVPTVQNNSMVLMDNSDPESPWAVYYQTSGYLFSEFINEDQEIFSGVVDETAATYTIGEKIYSITNYYDDINYVHTELRNGDERIIIKNRQFGIYVEDSEGDFTYYTYYYTGSLVGSYQNSDVSYDLSYVFDEETYDSTLALKVNGATTEFSYGLLDGRLAIVATVGGETYKFAGDVAGNIIIGNYEGENHYLLNYSNYAEIYANTYNSFAVGSDSELIVDSSFNVTFNGVSLKGNLIYNKSFSNPVLQFESGNTTYNFEAFSSEIGSFVLTDVSNGDKTYYITDDQMDVLVNEYTHNHEKDIIIKNDGTVTYFGTEFEFTYEAVYSTDSYSYRNYFIFTDSEGNKKVLVSGNNKGVILESTIDEKGQVSNLYTVYIPYSIFQKMIGSYSYVGSYGEEGFELTSDGHFYADVVNDTKDGLIKHVEMENFYYTLNNGVGAVAFDYNSATVFGYFDSSYSLITVVGINYVRDSIFAHNGVYFDSDLTHAFYMDYGELYLDGTKITVSSYDDSGDSVIINGTYNYSDITVTFTNGQVAISGTGLDYTLTKDDSFSFEQFLGTRTYNDVDYPIEVKKTLAGTDYGYNVTISGISYQLVPVVKNGFKALYASVLSTKYYFYFDASGEFTVLQESSIPVPPPLI